MKILYRYITRQVTVIFLVCLVVFTFILFIGNMLRIIEMMAKGVGISIIMKFLVLLIPFMLSYSIPISILTSVLLVFARLSADNEVTAIRASGINLKYIFKPVLFYTLVLVSICYIINDRLRPNAIYSGRKLLIEIGFQEPMINLTSGKFNEIFPNYLIYVGQKQGKILKRVVVYKFENEKLKSVITAESGQLSCERNKTPIKAYMKLNKGTVEEIPELDQETGKLNRMQFDTYTIEFNVEEKIDDLSRLSKKEREMTNGELANRIINLNSKRLQTDYKQLIPKLEQEISAIKTRMHNRVAMAISCFVFVLVGIPLGIKVHRSETSVGAGISLIMVSFYYFLMTLGEAFQDKYSLYPWLFMWVPNTILLFVGIVLMHRLLKK